MIIHTLCRHTLWDTTHYMCRHNRLTLFPLTSIKTCCSVFRQGSAGWRKLRKKCSNWSGIVLTLPPSFHCELSFLRPFNTHPSIFGFLFLLFASKVTMVLICHATDTTVNLSLEKIRKNLSQLIYETRLTIDTSAKFNVKGGLLTFVRARLRIQCACVFSSEREIGHLEHLFKLICPGTLLLLLQTVMLKADECCIKTTQIKVVNIWSICSTFSDRMEGECWQYPSSKILMIYFLDASHSHFSHWIFIWNVKIT